MTATFQWCRNCLTGQPGYPHEADCPRPKYYGEPDADAPADHQNQLRKLQREAATKRPRWIVRRGGTP